MRFDLVATVLRPWVVWQDCWSNIYPARSTALEAGSEWDLSGWIGILLSWCRCCLIRCCRPNLRNEYGGGFEMVLLVVFVCVAGVVLCFAGNPSTLSTVHRSGECGRACLGRGCQWLQLRCLGCSSDEETMHGGLKRVFVFVMIEDDCVPGSSSDDIGCQLTPRLSFASDVHQVVPE